MQKLNKFEIAAELDTEEKRDVYLSAIFGLDQTMREMTDYIDIAKLASEDHPKELLLSKEWQKGYECCVSRTQKTIQSVLEATLTGANTTIDAAARLCIGGEIASELGYHSFINKKDLESLLNTLVKSADDVHADAFCMYDPEMHPDLAERIKDGKGLLFYWTESRLNKAISIQSS